MAPLQNLVEQDSVHKPPSPIPGPRRCAVSVYIGPDVVLLEAVPGLRLLVGREARERNLGRVVVEAVNVGVGVVGNVVLITPGVAREAEQRVRRPRHEVVQAPLLEIGAVIRVMLHAERGQHRAGNEAQEAEGSDDDARVQDDQDAPGAGGQASAIGALR